MTKKNFITDIDHGLNGFHGLAYPPEVVAWSGGLPVRRGRLTGFLIREIRLIRDRSVINP